MVIIHARSHKMVCILTFFIFFPVSKNTPSFVTSYGKKYICMYILRTLYGIFFYKPALARFLLEPAGGGVSGGPAKH